MHAVSLTLYKLHDTCLHLSLGPEWSFTAHPVWWHVGMYVCARARWNLYCRT